MIVLFFKAHVQGHTRTINGRVVQVRPYDTRRPSARITFRGKDRDTEDMFNPELSGDLYDPKARARMAGPKKSPVRQKSPMAQASTWLMPGDLFADPPIPPDTAPPQVKKPEFIGLTKWSERKGAWKEVGDIITRQGKPHVVVSAEMPDWVPSDAMSMGAPGGMESGWAQGFKVAEMPDIDVSSFPKGRTETLADLFRAAEKGVNVHWANRDQYKDAIAGLGAMVGVFDLPQPAGRLSAGPSLVIYENGIKASTPVYDDDPRTAYLFDPIIAASAKSAFESPEGQSAASMRNAALRQKADALLHEWGVKTPEKSIAQRMDDKSASKRNASAKRKPAFSSVPQRKPAASHGRNTATYKGKSYKIGWQGQTKYGHRTKLVMSDGREFWVDTSALSKSLTLFFRSIRPGLSLQTTTDKGGHSVHRWKKTGQDMPAGRPPKAAETGKPERRGHGPEEARGAAHGYGTHNIEEGDTLHFEAGDFKGSGKATAIGKDGATVTDSSGREHRVHWHEIRGFKAEGRKQQPENGPAPKEGQEPIPPEHFDADDYRQRFDDPNVTPESILDHFPPDTKDKIAAAQDRLKTVEETIGQYRHKDGTYDYEREKIHKSIFATLFANASSAKPPEGQQPTFVILGGRGGSGKSSFKGAVYDPAKCIVLDADAIKGMLPEYEGWNAHQVHEESSDILEKALVHARENGLNLVLDATCKTAKSAIAKVQAFRGDGYRVEAHYMHLPRQEAAKRAVGRFLNGGPTGRFVPPAVVLGNTTNEASFDAIRQMADAWSFRDNFVPKGSPPILISGEGEPALMARLEKAWKRAILKAMDTKDTKQPQENTNREPGPSGNGYEYDCDGPEQTDAGMRQFRRIMEEVEAKRTPKQ